MIMSNQDIYDYGGGVSKKIHIFRALRVQRPRTELVYSTICGSYRGVAKKWLTPHHEMTCRSCHKVRMARGAHKGLDTFAR